ncbi:ABC transporter substrate-binding protein [Yinghuangia seranimata]|uniref:ABC transporter substrate-binding protein n=1 Tax=Yinghuangia seranimata TaxID=408067 RepID=UPI00248CEF38|nr:ABC transporter substrate-binding protein [Yinghuangia seranimata]MDI2129285.1 ABC transporter substrate-binding protein [Yinghuangia seranimata]
MSARLRKPLVVVAAATALLAAGCASDDSGKPFAADTPKPGGSMTILLPGEARGLDPFSASYINVTDGNRMAALYDMLVWTDPTTGSVQPQIASNLAPVDNTSKVWMLTLRDGVNFSDGEPYDAAAVKTNWDRHADPAAQSVQRASAAGLSTRVVDKLRLEITLPQPNANFDRMVARSLSFIASPKSIASGKMSEAPIGAGPFVLKPGNWVKNSTLTLDRNPDYWKKGAPYLDRLVFKVDPDPVHSVGAVDRGEADATTVVDPLAADAAKRAGLGTEPLSLSGGQMLSFNTAKGPFATVEARHAVAYALSGEAINQQVFQGTGTVARGIFSSNSPLANIQLTAPDNNPAEAARLFDKLTANGSKPLNATLMIPNVPASVKIAQYVQATLNTYRGVKVNVEILDLPTFIFRSNIDRRFDVKIDQVWLDDPEPGLFGFLQGDNPANCCFYNNPQVNDALMKARTTTDTSQRREAYTQVQVALNTDMPVWVYQEAVALGVYAPRITGVQLFNDGVFLVDRIGMRK